jgi:uncharacterized membrane protein
LKIVSLRHHFSFSGYHKVLNIFAQFYFMKKTSFLWLSSLILIGFILFNTACKHEAIISTVNPVLTVKDSIITTPIKDTLPIIGWKCSADSVYFQYDVLPVLVSGCAQAGCHDAVTAESGYRLTDYVNTIKKGVIAGKATSSKIYAEMANGSMPPRGYGTMTQAQKDIVAKWINQGAKNLSCNPNFGKCDTTNITFAAIVQPIVQNKCQGCHSGTSPSGGLALTNYTQVSASVKTGKFWGTIAQLAGFSPMPVGSKLQTCELDKINAWIKRGALNN